MNRGSTASFVPPLVYVGVPLFVLAQRRAIIKYEFPDILGMIKGLQRQMNAGTQVSSKERRALAVALMKR